MLEALERLADKFGVSTAILAGIGVLFWYVAVRLFAKDGILTKVGDRHLDFVDNLERTIADVVSSVSKIAKATQDSAEAVSIVSESREGLHRAALHSCDILEHVADALEISEKTKGSIESIRMELNR